MKNKSLINFGGRYIPRERVISFWTEQHKIFPYVNRKSKHCIAIELDNGKIFRQWYYDEGYRGGYSSTTNCEQAMGDFIRNYY